MRALALHQVPPSRTPSALRRYLLPQANKSFMSDVNVTELPQIEPFLRSAQVPLLVAVNTGTFTLADLPKASPSNTLRPQYTDGGPSNRPAQLAVYVFNKQTLRPILTSAIAEPGSCVK